MVDEKKGEIRLQGLALSRGCAVARVCMFNETRHSNLPIYKVGGEGVEHEKSRVKRAIQIVGERLEQIRSDVEKEIGHAEAEIFVAHKMILEDSVLSKEVFDYISGEQANAEAAVVHVLNSYESRLRELESDHMRERATDFAEIKGRLLDVLGNMQPSMQCAGGEHCQKGKNRIIVADELTPSLTIEVDPANTIGFVTEHGGVNSHAAILARAMGIPAVSGISGIRDRIACGTEVLVDGDAGEIVISPEEETIARLRARREEPVGPPEPVDPVEGFKVMANVSLTGDIEEANTLKAEGIGLYRTEFEVMAAGRFFTEDELYDRYVDVGRAMAGKGVIFRMFDFGSDKSLPFMDIPNEENPALGWRGARLLLGRPDIMCTQARALARTSVGGRIHVMYPMVVDVDQFHEIKTRFMQDVEGIAYGEILHGIMFEVPSACLQARELLEVADFASIGTNDLTQYLFAVDRDNERVTYDYHPDRGVFWDLLRDIASAAAEAEKPLSICGELAGEPKFTAKLMELGITSVSVSARRISGVRNSALDAGLQNKQSQEDD